MDSTILLQQYNNDRFLEVNAENGEDYDEQIEELTDMLSQLVAKKDVAQGKTCNSNQSIRLNYGAYKNAYRKNNQEAIEREIAACQEF